PALLTRATLRSPLPVHPLCFADRSAAVPSMVTFTLSPAASYTTVWFFGIPAGSFDFDSFSFQVPICTSVPAKHTAAAANRNASVIAHVFVFILPPRRSNCLGDYRREF